MMITIARGYPQRQGRGSENIHSVGKGIAKGLAQINFYSVIHKVGNVGIHLQLLNETVQLETVESKQIKANLHLLSLLAMFVLSTVQSFARTLFTMLFCSLTPQ